MAAPPLPRLVDTHCHLDFEQFDADRDVVLQAALAAGVAQVLVPAVNLAASRRAIALAQRYPAVRAAVGLHPTYVAGFDNETLAELRDLSHHPGVDAIGEIGIDLYWKQVPLNDQLSAFRAQLALAQERGLPIIIHDREAHAEVMAELTAAAPTTGVVLHAFSGDHAMAVAAVEAGYYLGVDGPLTYKPNAGLRAIFAAAPAERILIETDAPYLPPQARRGTRNEPAYVRFVAEKLAEVRGRPLAEIAALTTANAARLFRWEL
ncbi:MAG: TatD family hydrolase [Anaerolineales bacterium]|nr:TatD family hydrolase [Anaerolineales bacterium]